MVPTEKEKVLIVTRNFPPLTGGMERLNHQVFLALGESFDVALCGPSDSAKYAKGTLCKEFNAAPAWRYVLESAVVTLKTAIKFKPDVIYAGSGLAAHAGALASIIMRVPLVTYLHGLDIIASNLIYQALFLPAIRRSNHIIVNSRNTAKLAEAAGIPANHISIIHPGTSLPDFFTRDTRRAILRESLRLNNRPVILAAGRLTARKGLVEFIRNCMPQIIKALPETRLLIVGEPPSQALSTRADNILAEIQIVIKELRLEKNIQLLGKVDDDMLSSIYFASDVFVFPVLDLPGDVEGFGMVAVEAAAHGLPTVGFAVGGVPDAVSKGISGWLSRPGDYHGLRSNILNLLQNREVIDPQMCRQHAESFSWGEFGAQIREIFGHFKSNTFTTP